MALLFEWGGRPFSPDPNNAPHGTPGSLIEPPSEQSRDVLSQGPSTMTPAPEAYRAVTDRVGFLDRSDRVRLEVAGPDRAKFLHNLTTNEVKRLAVGRGCEAFVTSPQGKTLGYVSLMICEDRILVRTNPGGLELALP